MATTYTRGFMESRNPRPSSIEPDEMPREGDPPRWVSECEGDAQKTHSWSKNGSGRAVCNHCDMELTVVETWDCFGEREET